MKRSCMFCDGRGYQPLHQSWWQFWLPTREECFICRGKGYRSSESEAKAEEAVANALDGINKAANKMIDKMAECFNLVAVLNQTQYTETIGLDTPFEGVFISDTASGVCMSALQVELKRWEPILEQWSGNLDRIGCRCSTSFERSFEPAPADRGAVIKEAKEIVKPVSDKCGVTDEKLDALLYHLLAVKAGQDCGNVPYDAGKAADALKRATDKLEGEYGNCTATEARFGKLPKGFMYDADFANLPQETQDRMNLNKEIEREFREMSVDDRIKLFGKDTTDRGVIAMLDEKHSLAHDCFPMSDDVTKNMKRFIQMPGCPWPKPGDWKAAMDKASGEPMLAEDGRIPRRVVNIETGEEVPRYVTPSVKAEDGEPEHKLWLPGKDPAEREDNSIPGQLKAWNCPHCGRLYDTETEEPAEESTVGGIKINRIPHIACPDCGSCMGCGTGKH